MKNTAINHNIGVLAYPGAQKSAIYGLVDLLSIADSVRKEGDNTGSALTPVIIESFGEDLSAHQDLAAIIIPPSLEKDLGNSSFEVITRWLKARHDQGVLICSVCAGAFILAKTGLIEGRTITTHWMFEEQFRNDYPNIDLNINKLIVDDGDIVTAGGLSAWMDLGLFLVGRFTSPSIMLNTARIFLVDIKGREQSFFSTFTPNYNHGDKPIVKAQRWAQQHFSSAMSVSDLSDQASLSRRTFIRRFKKATHLNPSEYIQQLRIAKAKEGLELTNERIEAIAWSVGYEDVSAFRRIFQKSTGLSPTAYRQRFSVAEENANPINSGESF
ncbi:GlxA family transcriptional regulator [Pseudoteredinibacter isoporae]|uniref:Transcriptional regulator GlxA family with amidase domain n=1 Tax=Pseudoteredinibacter isoporae TaxID=570281 RepID=A0A7X0JUH1_9GAMM|nr:helix-turn-helix domain-containing protein [Pseudoteredinibacter isoporae]MBB6522515.1 transcriptional regulator GlxA family with amidase domain [Pseudoteredinibacter isoporae]NHO88044.1 helix-turn-helix domain-containing protein [Pseudoteredinibacter isoporae]NIB23625.1 helix-turn-helix domain-containing protein [Pseudoteredinibacter isoporae]